LQLNPEDFAFPNGHGGASSGQKLFERILAPATKVAGLCRVTWLDFRNIQSSLLLGLGVPAKAAQQQLGHASPEITLNLYSHVVPETHRRVVHEQERVLLPNVPKLDVSEKEHVC
jgi:integrase